MNIDYTRYYLKWHDDSDEHAKFMSTVAIRDIEPYLPLDRNARILEIGCGMGFGLLRLRDLGFKNAVGVDIDKSQVDACVKRNLNVELTTDLTKHLEQYPHQFDAILMIDVLEHIPVPAQIDVLRSIQNTLRPGGRLITQVPNANSIISARWRNIDLTHTSTFTEYSLKFALLSANFKTVNIPATGNKLARPTLRIHRYFKAHTRMAFRRWLVRWIWRQILIAELGTFEIDSIPLNPNLFAIADT